jgi:hypothetical protein
MSGIFKGDSIYKSGGGGGGYKDGGQLVDGDFIEVKNNTISSYDNVSRDPVNFYFEAKDGEVLNSVIELTTAVNATVNVYVVKNGLYYILGNVGGNTVNAGDDYKVNITGDSYAVENVTGISNEPKFFKLKNGSVTPLNFICNYDSKKWYATGNLGNYLNYSDQERIAQDNPGLEMGPVNLMSYIRDNVPDPKIKFGITEYPGSKYFGNGPYDLGTAFYFFYSSLSYGKKFTSDSTDIKDAGGFANNGNRYSTILFYSE